MIAIGEVSLSCTDLAWSTNKEMRHKKCNKQTFAIPSFYTCLTVKSGTGTYLKKGFATARPDYVALADSPGLERAQRQKEQSREGHSIARAWLLRAGLTDPSISLRNVAELLGDVTPAGDMPVSHSSVHSIRDSFATCIKDLCAPVS